MYSKIEHMQVVLSFSGLLVVYTSYTHTHTHVRMIFKPIDKIRLQSIHDEDTP